MDINIRGFRESDLCEVNAIWNSVVKAGTAFPQTECLGETDGLAFFSSQSFTGTATDAQSGEIVGLYILHPNNVGRCAHIANASYAVRQDLRGRHIGEALVVHCMQTAKALGFRILQFNAVVSNNYGALHLYEKLGFVRLGVIPGGFLLDDDTYQDIIPHYHAL